MKFAAAAFAALSLCAAFDAQARTWSVEPGPNAQRDLQAAFDQAQPGDTVRLARGRYDLAAGLKLNVDRVTVRGDGADRSVLSFANQTRASDALAVTSDRVVLQGFAIEDALGDAFKASDCHGVTFRDLRAEWTGGANPRNGGFGIAAINCDNVLVDTVISRGAADSGIHVGQSRAIIIRDSTAERNVAGIEVENSFNADVFGNTVVHNAVGVMVYDLPGLAQHGGHETRVFRNTISANDGVNFAPRGGAAAELPTGIGVLLMATRDAHVFQNDIGDNGTVNIALIAYRGSVADAAYDSLPRDIMVRNNTFGRSGFAPSGDFAALAQTGVRLPDVLWDGASTYFAGGAPHQEIVRIVMRNNRVAHGDGIGAFLSLGVPVAGSDYADAQPDSAYPPILDLEEPRAVFLQN